MHAFRAPSAATTQAAPGPWLGGWYALLPIVLLASVRGLWAPDEPRYAEIAREIWDGDWLVLHLNGELYPDKPPLVYWLAALCGAASGWSELALRLPSLAATALSAWLAQRLALRLLTPGAAAWVPLCYLGSLMLLEIGGRLQLDPVLACLCLASVTLASDTRGAPGRVRNRRLAAGLCAGLAALAKGPVAWLHIGVGLLALGWVLRDPESERGGAPRARAPGWPSWCACAALALAPVLGWALLASAREPALYGALFFGQHVGRVVDGTQHPGPPWEHLLHFPLLFLPWTPVFVLALAEVWRRWRARASVPLDAGMRARLALSLWFLVLFAVFSAMPPKRDLYLLPLYPAAALLAAAALDELVASGRVPRRIGLPVPLLWSLLGLAGLAGGLATLLVDGPGALSSSSALAESWPLLLELRAGLSAVSALLLAGGTASLLLAWRRRPAALELGAATLIAAVALAAVLVVPRVDRLKSARELALQVAARPERPSRIACVGVQPEGYRFYARLPTVKEELAPALEREGRQFLALITRPAFERLPPELRARVVVLASRSVGARDVLVLGASP